MLIAQSTQRTCRLPQRQKRNYIYTSVIPLKTKALSVIWLKTNRIFSHSPLSKNGLAFSHSHNVFFFSSCSFWHIQHFSFVIIEQLVKLSCNLWWAFVNWRPIDANSIAFILIVGGRLQAILFANKSTISLIANTQPKHAT